MSKEKINDEINEAINEEIDLEEVIEEAPDFEKKVKRRESKDEDEDESEKEETDELEVNDTEDSAKVKKAGEEEEALNVKYLRLLADFQNFKKRSTKEKGDIYSYANEKIIMQMLDVIDSFERALGQECSDKVYVEGMKMIYKQLMGVLEKAGLKEMNALGEDFDPNYHNAVLTEDTDEYESGKVSDVMQKGYLLNTKVLRPAMVKVNN